jgi:hypothetical protein
VFPDGSGRRPVLAISIAGCARKEPAPGEGTSPAALNASPQITNFAVYAQNSATLRDRTVLTGGDIGVHVAGTGPFLITGYELALARVFRWTRPTTRLRTGFCCRVRRWGTFRPTRSRPEWRDLRQEVCIPHDHAGLARAGAGVCGDHGFDCERIHHSGGLAGRVRRCRNSARRASLRLQGGVYHLASLQLDDGARIEALAPVQIRVAGRVTGRLSTLARVWIGAASGVTLAASDLRIEISGKNGTGGGLTETPIAAMFGTDATIWGRSWSPMARCRLGSATQ